MDDELRLLASSLLEDDRAKRLKNMRRLQAYVASHKETFASANYFKLWEAFFYALWSADNPTVQRRIAVDFLHLLRSVPSERIEEWMDAFWFIMMREWDKLDRYRLDKFHLYLRMFIAESFSWASSNNWSEQSIAKLTSSWVLSPLRRRLPGETAISGVGYYLVEVLMEELKQEIKLKDIPSNRLVQLLSPFLKSLCAGDDKILGMKIRDKILLKLNPLKEGELEAVAEKLFEEAAQRGASAQTRDAYNAIEAIDKMLELQGRKANYGRVIEHLQAQHIMNQQNNTTGESTMMSIKDMYAASKTGRKASQLANEKKNKMKKLKQARMKVEQKTIHILRSRRNKLGKRRCFKLRN